MLSDLTFAISSNENKPGVQQMSFEDEMCMSD